MSNDEIEKVALLREQREQALACLWLAATIILAVFFSVFGKQPQLESARAAVLEHHKLLADAQQYRADNERVFAENQRAYQELLRRTQK